MDRKHIVISARKKTADYRNIQIKNKQKQKRFIKASSIIAQRDILIIIFEK
jgi:hypothetical protein